MWVRGEREASVGEEEEDGVVVVVVFEFGFVF